MNIKIINNILDSKKRKVFGLISDIEYFNSYVYQNGSITDSWFFKNVITHKYWRLLKNYTWLNAEKQVYLEKGIMSILLFMAFMAQDDQIKISNHVFNDILKSLLSHSPNNKQALKLQQLTIDACINILKPYTSNNNGIMKSISWTLDNIILKEKKDKSIINQR